MEDKRFVDNGDGTITDTLTTLMWLKDDSFIEVKRFFNYKHAVRYKDKKNADAFAGHTDWRLPDKREAHSLFDKQKNLRDKYDMDIHIDPVFSPGCGYSTWTSNTRGKITAYVYSFNSGSGGHKEVDDILDTSVRLVRGKIDPSRVKLDKVPEVRDKITQGAGWR